MNFLASRGREKYNSDEMAETVPDQYADTFKKLGLDYQKFTPRERECISRNISKKIREGMPRDQAVAVAINICAPEKSRAASLESYQQKLPGGDYVAKQNEDGTWNIFDVPIFAEHTVPRTKERKKITAEWLQAAVDRAQKRLREDRYLAPLHVHHHGLTMFGTSRAPERAGFVLPKAVRKMKYEGREVNVLFADLLRIPGNVYERIRNGELPYRSVEIADINEPEISSLALLENEVPFFRFPLLTVKQVGPSKAEKFGQDAVPAFAYRAAEPGAAVLFKFDGGKLMKYEDSVETEEEKKKKREQKDEGKKSEQMQENPGEEVTLKAIAELLKKIAEKLGVLGSPDEAGKEEEAEGVPAEVKAASPAGEAYSKTFAELQARIGVLEARMKAAEKERKIAGMVQAAVRELASYNLSDDAENDLTALARAGGEEAIRAYVSAVKKYGVKDVPREFLAEFGAATEAEPEEVLKYSAQGPEKLELARKFSRMYDQVKHVVTVPRDVYIATEMERVEKEKLNGNRR